MRLVQEKYVLKFDEIGKEPIDNSPKKYPDTKCEYYFANLKDALNRLMAIDVKLFFNEVSLESDYNISKIGIFEIRNNVSLMSVHIVDQIDERDAKQPGIYYLFPSGINDFEKKANFDFSRFEGYDPDAPHLLMAKLVFDKGLSIKKSIAFAMASQRDTSTARTFPYFSFEVTIKQFSGTTIENQPQCRKVHGRKVFHFNELIDAYKKINEIDLLKTNKQTAWDNNYDEYFFPIEIKRDAATYSLIGFVRPQRWEDLVSDRKGIYMHLYLGTPFKEFNIKLPEFTDTGFNWCYFQIGKFSDDMKKIDRVNEKFPELALSPRKKKYADKPASDSNLRKRRPRK